MLLFNHKIGESCMGLFRRRQGGNNTFEVVPGVFVEKPKDGKPTSYVGYELETPAIATGMTREELDVLLVGFSKSAKKVLEDAKSKTHPLDSL